MKQIQQDYLAELDQKYENPDFLLARQKRFVLEWLLSRKKTSSLLDLGCGTGFFLQKCVPYFQRLVGIEQEKDGYELARKKLGPMNKVRLFHKNIETFSTKKPFEACVLLDVIEHSRKPELLIRVANKSLCSGGSLVITVPNWYDFIWSGLLNKNPYHLSYHTPWGWMKILRQEGFEILGCRATAFPIIDSDWLARNVYYLGKSIIIFARKKT